MILERDGHKYRIDLLARTVLEVEAAPDGNGDQPPAGRRPAPFTAATAEGEAIFKKHCVRCHGPDEKGEAAVGTPDFTDPKCQASLTDEELIATITNGRKGTIMPAWKGPVVAARDYGGRVICPLPGRPEVGPGRRRHGPGSGGGRREEVQ